MENKYMSDKNMCHVVVCGRIESFNRTFKYIMVDTMATEEDHNFVMIDLNDELLETIINEDIVGRDVATRCYLEGSHNTTLYNGVSVCAYTLNLV